MPRKKKAKDEAVVKQGAKFGLVGISNTVIDYTLYIGVSYLLGVPKESSYIVKFFSGGVAMLNSFYWNRRWTFHSNSSVTRSGPKFLIATLGSVFVVQPFMVWLFNNSWAGFGEFWYGIAYSIGLTGLMPSLTLDFVIRTAAFGMGVIGSAIWNFTLYKLWAFKEN